MAISSIVNDAKKITYLVGVYPSKSLQDILDLLLMPAISKDTAIWFGIESNWIEVDKKKGTISAMVNEVKPNEDDTIIAIQDRVIAGLRHQNADQEDVDEVMFLQWLVGFPPHDVLIAINLLLDEERISNYEIVDGENIYTFYTLPDNKDEGWGKKRFKNQKSLKVQAKDELSL